MVLVFLGCIKSVLGFTKVMKLVVIMLSDGVNLLLLTEFFLELFFVRALAANSQLFFLNLGIKKYLTIDSLNFLYIN
jgi:hypothetical protein